MIGLRASLSNMNKHVIASFTLFIHREKQSCGRWQL